MTPIFTDADILKNRKIAVAYLQKPSLRKAHGVLRASRGRCCLGHMCDALGIPEKNGNYGADHESVVAPNELIDMLGLNDADGTFAEGGRIKNQRDLTGLNDGTRTSPQTIGKILEGVLDGKGVSPWKEIKV